MEKYNSKLNKLSINTAGDIEDFYELNEESLSGRVVDEIVEEWIKTLKNRLPNKMRCHSVIKIISECLLERVNDTEIKL